MNEKLSASTIDYYNRLFKECIRKHYEDELTNLLFYGITYSEDFREFTGRYIAIRDYVNIFRYVVRIELDGHYINVTRYELINAGTYPKIGSHEIYEFDTVKINI